MAGCLEQPGESQRLCDLMNAPMIGVDADGIARAISSRETGRAFRTDIAKTAGLTIFFSDSIRNALTRVELRLQADRAVDDELLRCYSPINSRSE